GHLEYQNDTGQRRPYNSGKISGHGKQHKVVDVDRIHPQELNRRPGIRTSRQAPDDQKREKDTAGRPRAKADSGEQETPHKKKEDRSQSHLSMGQFLDQPMPGTKKLRRCKSQNTGKKKGDQKLLPLRQSGRFLKKFLGLQRKPVIECSEDAKYYSQPKYQPIV